MLIKELYKQKIVLLSLQILVIVILFAISVDAQTSGKLKGRVVDSNGDPLIGANILVTGTTTGTTTDVDGYYAILNLRTGIYSVEFRYVGYQSQKVTNIHITPDQSTEIDVTLKETAFESKTVTVVAQKPLVEFNQTSSVVSVSTEDIQKLPVQSLSDVVGLQAGVITDANGDVHFRGGRTGEVQFQVDGVTVNNPYDNSSTLQLDKSILQEVQVISGTFDAKYGQAMSGVVNAVLKTGSENFKYSGEVYTGSYYTADANRYPHDNIYRPYQIQNYQLTLSGPAIFDNTTFFISGRRYINDGYLFGERRFVTTDVSDFENKIFNPTGDNALVPMQTHHEWSGQFKISNRSISRVQLSYVAILNSFDETRYDNNYRFLPDGIAPRKTFSLTQGFDITHTITNQMFYNLNFRYNYFDYKNYKYNNVFDPRYLIAGQPTGDGNYEYGAIVQGVSLDRFIQKTNDGIAKLDYSWQANRANLIEAGLEGEVTKISFGQPGFLKQTTVNGVQILQPHVSTDPHDQKVETYYPRQGVVYLQDRIELGDLVVRGGLRLQVFDANSYVPSDLENPANAIQGAPQSYLKNTTIKHSIAPRIGLSFPLTSSASIYFSYGHFYQMPGLGDLYTNSNYLVLDQLQAGGIDYGVLGNPDLKPQFTVQYEVGLKQALTEDLGTQLTFFSKDIRDLLGVEFINTYTDAEYARLTNVDFGNVFGITLSLDERRLGPFSANLDYTLQFAYGNSSDPRETANRAQAGKDSRPRDVPFNWDQRHTLNLQAIYYVPNDLSISTIIRFGSGQPYTPQIGPASFTSDLQTNSGRKSSYLIVDLRAEKFFNLDFMNFSIFARVHNLLNENTVNGFVFSGTGSPDYTLTPATNAAQLRDPSRFYEPRRIEVGISFSSN